MIRFVRRRFLMLLPVLLVGTGGVWALLNAAPGDPARIRLGPDATEAQVLREREQLGLDGTVIEQFARWLGRAVRGDLGYSFSSRAPVTEVIVNRLPLTITLTVLGLLLSAAIAIPVGLWAAVNATVRRVASAYCSVALALPSFWVGILLVSLVSVRWQLLPAGGYSGLDDGVGEMLRHLALPLVTLSIYGTGILLRFVAATSQEVITSEYVVAAMARGIPQPTLLRRYVLKNTLVSIVTVAGLQLGLLMGGVVVLEAVFNLPGIGSLLFDAVLKRDYPVIQGVALFSLCVFLVVNFAVDVLYSIVDPRVRLAATSASSPTR